VEWVIRRHTHLRDRVQCETKQFVVIDFKLAAKFTQRFGCSTVANQSNLMRAKTTASRAASRVPNGKPVSSRARSLKAAKLLHCILVPIVVSHVNSASNAVHCAHEPPMSVSSDAVISLMKDRNVLQRRNLHTKLLNCGSPSSLLTESLLEQLQV